ncbi:MAG: PRC-barrel domain-containing protein [Candidatus Parcubacteria bacterium]|nr:PRC-barrel domain-containing protein [Candidatus Paceibacterota bacterium]
MSIKANPLTDLPVITLKSAKKIGNIKYVVYNSQNNQVTAFVVDEKGWFSDAKIILIADINSIGKDAILVEDESKIISANNKVDLSIALTANDNNFLDASDVITQDGTKLGTVTDIYFDAISGKLDAIEVSGGFLKDLFSGVTKIPINEIITVGKEYLIVQNIAEADIEHQVQEQGVNKVIQGIQTTTVNVATQVSQKAQEASERLKIKANEVIYSDTVQDMVSKTQEIASDIKDKATDTFTKTKASIDSGQAEADLKEGLESFKGKIADVSTAAKDKAVEVVATSTEKVQTTIDQAQEKAMQDKVNSVLGKEIADPLVYGKDDIIIAMSGDIITPRLIEIARENDALDKLIRSV